MDILKRKITQKKTYRQKALPRISFIVRRPQKHRPSLGDEAHEIECGSFLEKEEKSQKSGSISFEILLLFRRRENEEGQPELGLTWTESLRTWSIHDVPPTPPRRQRKKEQEGSMPL